MRHKFSLKLSKKSLPAACLSGRQGRQGFSLLEVIIAIFVITTGIVGAMNLINYSISSVAVSKSQIIASGLSQEGLEVVRNIRDTNWAEQFINPGLLWNDNLADGDYYVQYNSNSLLRLGANPVLNINSNGFYLYNTIEPNTLFRRKITITNISANEIKVVSEVTWAERGHSFSVSAEERLFNWK